LNFSLFVALFKKFSALHRLFFCHIPVKKLVTIAIVFKGDNKEELSVNLKFTQFRTSHTTLVGLPVGL